MHTIFQSFPTLDENLAMDEALLDRAIEAEDPCEVFRLWESPSPAVVMGRSSREETEVRADRCRTDGVPIARRSSGGTTVLLGPGCLLYAVVLDLHKRPALRRIDRAHQFVLETNLEAIASLGVQAQRRGLSDLTLGEKKFSGNSLRVRGGALLYHGTFLYDFPLEKISCYLGTPVREPDYRRGRPHERFVTNLPVEGIALAEALTRVWAER